MRGRCPDGQRQCACQTRAATSFMLTDARRHANSPARWGILAEKIITAAVRSMSDERDQWWIASTGATLVWARLRILDSGVAEVFGARGETLRYDDEDAARMALLDAEFRTFDGLDAEDAALLGFDFDSLEPPQGMNDDELLPQMTEKLLSGHS